VFVYGPCCLIQINDDDDDHDDLRLSGSKQTHIKPISSQNLQDEITD